jgi:hypothetical protein
MGMSVWVWGGCRGGRARPAAVYGTPICYVGPLSRDSGMDTLSLGIFLAMLFAGGEDFVKFWGFWP